MITIDVAYAEFFENLCTLHLSVQLSMLKDISLNLGVKLFKFSFIGVFVINHILQD